jgi:hypothetical protein
LYVFYLLNLLLKTRNKTYTTALEIIKLTNMKKVFLLIIIFQFISCSNEEIQNSEIDFDGYYKIESISSIKSVDLNNDDISSFNLLEEIPNYFENYSYDLVIRKLEKTNPFELSFGFYLPVPNEYIDKSFGTIDYNRYAFFESITPYENVKLINHRLEFKLINHNMETGSVISINELKKMTNNKIYSKFIQKFYDFKNRSWKDLEIEIIYTKVN